MALENIITYITGVLAGLTGSGIVLNYEPIATAPQDILSVFGGDQSVNAWAVSLNDQAPTREERLTNIEVMRTHTFRLTLYQSVTTAGVSEPPVRVLSEAAMLAFRPVIRLGPPQNVERSDPLQRVEATHVMLGGTLLCHYFRHSLTLYELLRNTG